MFAGFGDYLEFFEKTGPAFRRERLEDVALQFEGNFAGGYVGGLAQFQKTDAMGAAVIFMGGAFEKFRFGHAFEEGGDGVWVAAHAIG